MIAFGSLGYLVTAGLYLLLVLLLLTVWRGRRLGGFLLAACVAGVGWGGILAWQTIIGLPNGRMIYFAEVLRAGAWLAFLSMLMSQLGVQHGIRIFAQGLWISLLALGVGVTVFLGAAQNTPAFAAILIPGGLAMSLAGLMLIEQVYRNSLPEARWRLKTLVLGAGGLFAYDLFMYSQALLLGGVDVVTWGARGIVNTIFVPMIAVAARRNPSWELRIFVSRQVVFYTTTLIAVGVYLLLMSLGGYLLVRMGGTWGGLAQIVFFAGAIVVLVSLLFSGTLRARVRVFLSKHFFQNKYDYREEWLRLVTTLAEFGDSSTRQVVVKAMAQIVDSPSGHLWLLEDEGSSYRHVAAYGTDALMPDLPEDDPVVRFIKKDGWLVDMLEYQADPSRYHELDLPEWLSTGSLAWLVVPLMAQQKLLGLILLNKSPGAPVLNYEDRDLLKTVGSHVAVHLAQERTDRLLSEAQQFEAYNRLTAFLMHDLNNLVAQQSLIVSNAEKHRRNPDFVDDAIRTIANSVERMQSVLNQLKRGSATAAVQRTSARRAVESTIERCSDRRPRPELVSSADGASLVVDSDQFTMILSHLVRNAQDATEPDGNIELTIDRKDSEVVISVVDDGAGMTPQFIRDHLFKPFDSTKGSQGMGIGAYQAREFARKLGGDLQVQSAVGQGTTVRMCLPER
jgi:putative PEP-CTERM system histidine kinase